MINFKCCTFQELTNQQIYNILALRSDIFVVEQKCIYLDPDGKDPHAYHLLGEENSDLVAYLRIFPPNDIENYIVFGRVVTARFVRSKGYGKQLMQAFLSYCVIKFPDVNIKCSAQLYLKKFYESFGFNAYGEVYDEDGIPHIAMEKTAD